MRGAIALLVMSLLAVACGGDTSRKLTDADSGSEVAVSVGDLIEVSLEENPSTGYRWEVVSPPAMIELTDDDYLEPDTDAVGAPGTRELRFEATAEEAGILRLEYIRPFDDPPVPERIVEYIIIVGDAVWPPVPTGSPPGTSTDTAPTQP
jgi:inhibitor of cysteine peptidase